MGGLAFRDVTKRFGEVTAVDRFSLDIEEGEFVALVGPSGCGKTTSLRIMAGLEAASSGRVLVAGRDVSHLPSRERNLAMVFQSYALYPHMTAAENIGFSLSLNRVPKADIARRTQEAADRLGIGHLLHRRPKELSGGQRQRVAVARCIVREPAAFLFDEPLSNLDAKLRGTARVEIAKLQKSLGVTTLYVTHDQVEAMTMADRIVLMEGGRVRQAGTPMDLYHRPCDLFVAGFLGSPPMNLIEGRVQAGLHGPEFVAGDLRLPLPAFDVPEGTATIGIRPELLSDRAEEGRDDLEIACIVGHVEQLGAETIVEVTAGGAQIRLTARLAGSHAIRARDALRLHLPTGSLHLFGSDGMAIGRARPAATAFQASQKQPGQSQAA